ncbi:olfactory receptor 1496-like [Electrophorus electricus]|uniref:olfactory receptor 1496-like n=1 Tax=Electrophorus electricus TaxID=8005 RepID=UPI0015CF8400|nr:olfactory receptor 1496-like [Electrophorus electricus]
MTVNMTSTQFVSSMNETFFRPTFYISGLYNIPHAKYYYVFLCFVYAVTVLGNSFIMGTIYLAQSLHTAKYIAVFNLAFSDLCGSSALVPKLLDMFLFDNQYISYGACLANMFFVYCFMTLQSLTLLALAYDRLVAICFPLRYHAVVTKTAMSLIIGIMWIVSVTVNALLVSLVTRLSFCRSTTVNSYFCDHGPIYKLACNDKSINSVMGYVCTAALLYIPLILITISYVCIGVALRKIARGGEQIKAMKTCTSHIILVALFYVPIISIYTAALTTSIDTNIRIINTALTQTIPPMLNPIIYTLKTEEVMQSIKVLYKRSKMKSAMKQAEARRRRHQCPPQRQAKPLVRFLRRLPQCQRSRRHPTRRRANPHSRVTVPVPVTLNVSVTLSPFVSVPVPISVSVHVSVVVLAPVFFPLSCSR